MCRNFVLSKKMFIIITEVKSPEINYLRITDNPNIVLEQSFEPLKI